MTTRARKKSEKFALNTQLLAVPAIVNSQSVHLLVVTDEVGNMRPAVSDEVANNLVVCTGNDVPILRLDNLPASVFELERFVTVKCTALLRAQEESSPRMVSNSESTIDSDSFSERSGSTDANALTKRAMCWTKTSTTVTPSKFGRKNGALQQSDQNIEKSAQNGFSCKVCGFSRHSL